MLTAVPLPDQPLTILWQSTLIDIEPGSRYGYRNDAAAINTTLAIINNTGGVLEFPLLVATTDPEQIDPSQLSVRVGSTVPALGDVDIEAEWNVFAQAIRAQAMAQGHAPERVDWYLAKLQNELRRAKKSDPITLQPGEQKFIRSYQRKRIKEREGVFEFRGLFPLPQFALVVGGSLSVAVALPRSTQCLGACLAERGDQLRPRGTRGDTRDHRSNSHRFEQDVAVEGGDRADSGADRPRGRPFLPSGPRSNCVRVCRMRSCGRRWNGRRLPCHSAPDDDADREQRERGESRGEKETASSAFMPKLRNS